MIRALGDTEPRSVTEVAEATGMTRAAARRFVLTLEELGYVKRSEDGRYRLTPRTLELGYAFLSSLTLPEIAEPHLRSLVAEVHESSSVSVLDGADVVYVARVPAGRIMTVQINVGTRFPAHATSMGRVLLAGLSARELDETLAAAAPRRLTRNTVTDLEELKAEIGRVRAQGYAIVDQELEEGLCSVAAPICTPAHKVVAAVNISTHASRSSRRAVERELLEPLRRTATAIEQDLR